MSAPTSSVRTPSTSRGRLRTRTRSMGLAGLAALAVLAAGCSDPYGGQLILADAPSDATTAPDIALYAVDPGEDPADDSTRVAPRALAPREILTTVEHGQIWANPLARNWKGGLLLNFGDGESDLVTAGTAGTELEELARSTTARTTVLRRGALLQTAEGCRLATSPEKVDDLGQGNCAIGLDERWLVSWPLDGRGLTIRDLRTDERRTLDDLQVTNAGVLSKDDRVLAIVRDQEGSRGVLLDARSGDEVGRTEAFEFLDVGLIGHDAKGFVLQAGSQQGSELLHMDTEGTVSRIDAGVYLLPVINGAEVTYLRYDQDLSGSSVRRWTPGEDEPETLLSGYVGAASADGEHVVVSRETAEGTEFWRPERGSGELQRVLTLDRVGGDADPSAGGGTGISVSRMYVHKSTAHLQVDGATTTSYVRIDLKGDHSDAPVEGAAGLVLESIDADGTALLARNVGTDQAPAEELLVVRPGKDEVDVRARVARTLANVIHEGTIYLTDATDPSEITVKSVRAVGAEEEPEVLYRNRQVAGASWPLWGGATRSLFVTPRLLLEQAQQQQQAAAGVPG